MLYGESELGSVLAKLRLLEVALRPPGLALHAVERFGLFGAQGCKLLLAQCGNLQCGHCRELLKFEGGKAWGREGCNTVGRYFRNVRRSECAGLLGPECCDVLWPHGRNLPSPQAIDLFGAQGCNVFGP